MLAGCAYVRPPKPPTLAIPVKIVGLGAFERGDQLVIDFTAPRAATDRAVLKKLREIELRAGPEGANWEATARRIGVPTAQPGPVHVQVPAAPWVGQSIEIRVRAAGKHGRFGQWSDAVRFKVVAPLAKPVVKVEAVPEGVRLSWSAAAGAEYRVYRLAPGELRPSLAATVESPEYLDNKTQYGKTYAYQVLGFVASGNSEAESEGSEAVSITPVDIFPPAVPAGLSAVAGVSSIEVSWNPDTEADLRGYYVFRSVNGGPFEKAGDLLTTPAYSDHAVEAGKHYRYQVSAVDQTGNESARSAVVETVAQ
jgi:hypothetical protein